MARLTASARNAPPGTAFGLPGKRAFPMPDRAHAANAKARATQAVKAGQMSGSTASRIKAKANRILAR